MVEIWIGAELHKRRFLILSVKLIKIALALISKTLYWSDVWFLPLQIIQALNLTGLSRWLTSSTLNCSLW
jgi:hypothetical protein